MSGVSYLPKRVRSSRSRKRRPSACSLLHPGWCSSGASTESCTDWFISAGAGRYNQDVTYRFGTFEFDSVAGQLWKVGRRVRLEPQPARLLALLLSRAGEVVPRDELKRQVWTVGTHVDFDRGLAFCLAQVRSALGDSAENPRFIETLPRRGVRFIAPVVGLEAAAAAGSEPTGANADEATPPATVAPMATVTTTAGGGLTSILQSRSAALLVGALAIALIVAAWMSIARRRGSETGRPIVAVAVFDNETGRRELDPLTAQVPDVIVARLLTIDPAQVGVIGNSRVLRLPRSERDLRAIERETRATFVILGQVQPVTEGIRVITHLIRLADGTHVWAQRFVRRENDLANLDEAIAVEVDRAIRARVLPAASSSAPTTR